ncbi:MAG: VWA domain-containing protein [Eubacterium sp.]|nr:VWA domain-containing protein [Eubacterium sp.]
MVLKYPIILEIGIPVLVVGLAAMLWFGRKKKYRQGLRAANTSFFRSLPEYAGRRKARLVLIGLMVIAMVGTMVSALILAARPYRTETTSNGVKKRDIFLCLDVSYSICYLNYDLVQSLEEVVAGLSGDRFGITIFNTSSVLYVPMTDDYDFIISRLEELKEYFRLQKLYQSDDFNYNFSEEYYDIMEKLEYFDAGTLVNNYSKGSSLIGEGLASCVYSFPRLAKEDRTRVIIMATDNAQMALSKPLIELDGAVELCNKNHITMFGLFPDQDTYTLGTMTGYQQNLQDFERAVEKTGGVFYQQSKTLTVEDIVRDIQKQEAMMVDELIIKREVDRPVPFIIMLLSFLAVSIATGVVLRL